MDTQKSNKIIWIIATILFIISIILIILTQAYTRSKQTTVLSPTPIPTTIIALAIPTLYPIADAMKLQAQADQNWGKAVIERNNLYPWLDTLPLSTDTYFIYFDVEKKKFIGKIYVKNGDDTAIKNEIILSLKNMGIDAERYGFIWK